MRTEILALSGSSIGTQHTVTALHFGDESAARKIYIQASLHADELPGALTAYHLRQLFLDLETEGRVKSHIVLVPLSNPIGLSQALFHTHIGRFEFFSGQNFNRLAGLNLYEITLLELQKSSAILGNDSQANVQAIRAAMSQALSHYQAKSAVENLHLTLLKSAFDADVVLDLHCDENAVLHMYMLPQLWATFEPLARYLGSQCQLLSEGSGANPFDEALSTAWLQLRSDYPHANIPIACATTTVELRSRADIGHEFAALDAAAIVQYLSLQGDLRLAESNILPIPELQREPYPLEGKGYILAPCSGVVVYHAKAGQYVELGELLAEIINPIEGTSHLVYSSIAGIIYANGIVQFTQQGAIMFSISGPVDLGLGVGLSP